MVKMWGDNLGEKVNQIECRICSYKERKNRRDDGKYDEKMAYGTNTKLGNWLRSDWAKDRTMLVMT
jgi:hypothetical protein